MPTLKVLIVDDDAFDSSIIETCIKAKLSDADITIVNDPEEAQSRYREVAPDLTLLDISMPKIDGFGVLQKLQQLPERQAGSIIMLSGSTSSTDKQRAQELGADGYCTKPSSLKQYRELTDELLTITAPSTAPATTDPVSLEAVVASFTMRWRRLSKNLPLHRFGHRGAAAPTLFPVGSR